MKILTKNLLIPAVARAAMITLASSIVAAQGTRAEPANANETEVGGQPLRMAEVISSIIKNNNHAAAAGYTETAARRKVGPAGAWDDPLLMIGITNLPTTWSFTDDMMTMKMIGPSQTIPYAGQKDLAAEAARMVRHD